MEPITVLSLFDGMSCGQIALERAGIPVKQYFASEVDKWAIKATQHNYPNTVQLGDVTKVRYEEGVIYSENGEYAVGKIDLVIAGSPCQGFSFAGKQLAFDDPRSSLYFEFERILKEISPRWFLLENVYMKKEHEKVINERLGVDPLKINSNLVSAQNRRRNYWTNIGNILQPEDKNVRLVDILERGVDSKYTLTEKATHRALNNPRSRAVTSDDEKTGALLANQAKQSTDMISLILDKSTVRKLTPVECERLQTVPDNYTSCVADSNRYKMLGNGWTVDVIAHIFKGMLPK